jgi:hypothetical protein
MQLSMIVLDTNVVSEMRLAVITGEKPVNLLLCQGATNFSVS